MKGSATVAKAQRTAGAFYSPMAKACLIFGILAAATVALLVLGVRQQMEISCEVCVTFHGAMECRTAAGRSHEEARRAAHENACALLASGMTGSISCQNTNPNSVSCSDEREGR